MPDTLPLSAELAREIADAKLESASADSAALIDARVRPLVTAIRTALEYLGKDFPGHAEEILESALKAAGAE